MALASGSLKAKLAMICVAVGISSCGSSKKTTDTPTTAASSTSYAAVEAAIKASCAGSTCHDASNSSGVNAYVGSQSKVDANKASIYSQVNSGAMPKSGYTITAADKATILAYTKSN